MRPSAFQAVLGALSILSLVAGCGDDDRVIPDFDAHPVIVAPAKQWAGGAITLSSAAFADWPPEDFPLLIGGDVMVTAHRTSDTTYEALIPDTLQGGHYLLQAAVIESPNFEADLDVAGWTDTRSVALTGTSGFSTPWPVDAPTGLVLVKDDTVRFVSATDDAIVTFPATTTTWRVPLGHDGAGHLLAPWSEDTLGVWSLDPDLGTAVVASASPQATFADNSYYRFGDGGALYTNHDQLLFEPGVLLGVSYITAPRPVIATATGRTVIPYRLMNADPGGIPIFRTDSGTIASLVSGYSRLDAAVFNSAGTVLYLATSTGGLASTSQSLVKVNALTGTVLDSIPAAPDPRAEDLALDEARGWVLEAVRDSIHWTLRVRDAATLELVAQMRSPRSSDGCQLEGELHLLPVAGAVYLGSAECPAGTGGVRFARFTLK